MEGRAPEVLFDVRPPAVRWIVSEHLDVELHGPLPLPLDGAGGEPDGVWRHGVDGGLDGPEIGTRIEERGEDHVTGNPGRGVEPGDHAVPPEPWAMGADERWAAAIWAARWPAPYPLSMLTTATPGAHAFSMASSGATPPNAAP